MSGLAYVTLALWPPLVHVPAAYGTWAALVLLGEFRGPAPGFEADVVLFQGYPCDFYLREPYLQAAVSLYLGLWAATRLARPMGDLARVALGLLAQQLISAILLLALAVSVVNGAYENLWGGAWQLTVATLETVLRLSPLIAWIVLDPKCPLLRVTSRRFESSRTSR